jgi:DNA mismatch endonuclease (patch repair protein)
MSSWPGDAQREKTSFGRLSRGQLMARVRSRGNETTEKRLVFLLRRSRLSGWRRHRPIPGRPDFVWGKAKVAVFVDGCFWHGHACGKNLNPKTNAEAWSDKIARNRARDRKNTKELRHRGWIVIRIWECQLASNPSECVYRIRRALLPDFPFQRS